MPAFHAVIQGLVQGVGFRYFTVRAAQRAGVFGWVKNRSDGSVEVEAIGDKKTLKKFLAELENGPTFARVDKIDLQWLDEEPGYDSFSTKF